MKPQARSSLLLVLLLAGCSGARVQAPPAPAPTPPPVEAGRAAFFFPLEIPLAEVGRTVEESLPPRVSDERKQEISGALQDDYYQYSLQRGLVETGFSGEWLTFSFPVRGSVTVGGRLAGLPIHETIELAGRVRGTASPDITPDWRPDPKPSARVELDRADVQVFGAFSFSVRSLLEERLNPLLDQELKRAAGKLMAGLAVRRKAEEAWRSLHVARRADRDENLWIRFQPLDISLARLTLKDGVLHTGIGVAGQLALSLGTPLQAPVVTLLPPLHLETEKAGGFELEAPVEATPGELSRWADRTLKGQRFRLGRDREMEITGAGLGVDADRMVLALDFKTGGRDGRLVLRGRPALDPGTSVLRLADLQYDLAAGSPFLRLADRLHRAEILERLQRSARLDLAPILGQAESGTARAVRELFPPGFRGEVRIAPIRILSLGISGGAVWARCRMTGTISPLAR